MRDLSDELLDISLREQASGEPERVIVGRCLIVIVGCIGFGPEYIRAIGRVFDAIIQSGLPTLDSPHRNN